MAKFRYTELFGPTVQGEGRYMGVPSIFLRMFGCNFRCTGFGIKKTDFVPGPNAEVVKIIDNIDQYKSLNDLPLVETGCDSYCSVYPQFKRFANDVDEDKLVEDILNLLPNKEWGDEHLVITGGEPLLGWQRAYPSLLSHPKMESLKEITFETNGTQKISNEFTDYLRSWTDIRSYGALTFSVSPKLSCSGESHDDAIKPDVVVQYQNIGYTYLKFVVATEEDVQEALSAIKEYKDAGFTGPVYLMPVGGTTNTFDLNRTQVAELAIKHGLRFSDRMHLGLYGNAWAT